MDPSVSFRFGRSGPQGAEASLGLPLTVLEPNGICTRFKAFDKTRLENTSNLCLNREEGREQDSCLGLGSSGPGIWEAQLRHILQTCHAGPPSQGWSLRDEGSFHPHPNRRSGHRPFSPHAFLGEPALAISFLSYNVGAVGIKTVCLELHCSAGRAFRGSEKV